MRHLSRKLWLSIVVLALAIATAFATIAPATSQAAPVASNLRVACPAIYPQPAWCSGGNTTPQYRLAPLNHTGWTYLNLNYCAPGMVCTMQYRISTAAWRWTGRQWVNAGLPGGWVYTYPYSGGFRWAWTESTGWLAISGGRFELR